MPHHFRKFLSVLFGTSFFLTVARLGGAGTGILLQILIARNYGAEVLGNYYLALSLAAVLSIFASMGYPWIVAPILSAARVDDGGGGLTKFLRVVWKDTTAMSVAIGIPVCLLIWIFPEVALERRLALIIGVATAPIYMWIRILGGVANAMKFFNLAHLPELLYRPLLIFLCVGGAILIPVQLSSISIVGLNFLVSIALLSLIAGFLFGHMDFGFFLNRAQDVVSREQHSKWRKLALPLIFSILFVNLFADMHILLVGLILPPHEAGILGVAIKIAALLVFAVQITHQVLLRDASDAHFSGNHTEMQAIIRKANLFSVAASAASLIVIVFFGKHILGFFGDEFKTAYVALIVLNVAQIIRALAGPAIQILLVAEHQKDAVPVYVWSTMVLIVSNVVLVPLYQYNGAALAVVITTLVWTLWLNHLVKQRVGYRVSFVG